MKLGTTLPLATHYLGSCMYSSWN